MVQRELVPFDGATLPTELVSWLRTRRVVLLGEEHGIVEHEALVLALAKALQTSGVRVLMLEGAHAESWLCDQYVLGKAPQLPPLAGRFMSAILGGIRALNSTLAEDERIHVRQVDINHRDWAFPSALALMANQGHSHRAVKDFHASLGAGWEKFSTPEEFTNWRKTNAAAYDRSLLQLEQALAAAPDGQATKLIVEMVEIARQSLAVRNIWETDGENAAHPKREEVIKLLVERELERSPGPVLLNMGGYHAQLSHVMGTPKVWLGEYLRRSSPQAKGSVASVYVAVASRYKGDALLFDVKNETTVGELFALVQRRAGKANAYLPLQNEVFRRQKVPVNYGGHVVTHEPQAQFDAFVLLASGHVR